MNRQLVHRPWLRWNVVLSVQLESVHCLRNTTRCSPASVVHPAAPNAAQVLFDQLFLRFRAGQRSRLPIEDCRRLQLPEKMPRRECSPSHGRSCSLSRLVLWACFFVQHEVTVALDSRKSVIDPCRNTSEEHIPSITSQSSLRPKRASSS